MDGEEELTPIDDDDAWLFAEPYVMVLSEKDFEAFMEVMNNPPEPTQALIDALRRYEENPFGNRNPRKPAE